MLCLAISSWWKLLIFFLILDQISANINVKIFIPNTSSPTRKNTHDKLE